MAFYPLSCTKFSAQNVHTSHFISETLYGFSAVLHIRQEGKKRWSLYAVGEIRFSIRFQSLPGDLVEYRYIYGDGNKIHTSQNPTTTHTYESVCVNCSAEVYVIAKEGLYYYYAKSTKSITVIGTE